MFNEVLITVCSRRALNRLKTVFTNNQVNIKLKARVKRKKTEKYIYDWLSPGMKNSGRCQIPQIMPRTRLALKGVVTFSHR